MNITSKITPRTMAMINTCNDIIDEYASAGYRMTLRQLYYQLVSRLYIENNIKSYKHLVRAMTTARWQGYTDLDALDDPGREPTRPLIFHSPQSRLEAAANNYASNWWRNGDYTVELWCEKDAVASILEPVARSWQITFQSCRGYNSVSSFAQAFARFGIRDKPGVILYLGDHDPSGLDMPRNLQDRFYSHGHMYGADDVTVEPIALNMEQVQDLSLPPNPAKLTDSRAPGYIVEHGYDSWELDAIDPPVMEQIANNAVQDLLPHDYQDRQEQDERDRTRMREIAATW